MTLIASMLADMPDLRLRVQAQHIPDQNGYCADCRDNIRWPCEVSRIAAEAERRGGRGHHTPAGLPWSAPVPGTGSLSGVGAGYVPSPMTPSMSGPLPVAGPLSSRTSSYAAASDGGYASGHAARPVPDPLSAPMYQGRYI